MSLRLLDTRSLAQHLERARLVEIVALHQDALGTLGQRAAPERSLQVVVLGEAAQHDVDRALPVLDVGVVDVSEDAPLGRLLDELGIAGVDQDDHRAGGLPHDLVDQVERMLRAVTEPDERDVGPLPGGDGAHVLDLDLARDHLVSEGGHDRRDQSQPILSLVGDQHAQMLGLAIAHELLQPVPDFSSGTAARSAAP